MQNLLSLGYISTSTINFHDFESFIEIDEIDSSFSFMEMQNALILHRYQLSCFKSFRKPRFRGLVKARSTTWYSQVLVIQYDDWGWIEHFRVNKLCEPINK
jgi:hypothetical protein